MPNDHRTPNEIEREIERERAELSSTVDELQDRFSPDTIIREVVRGFSDHGGDISRSISRSVKQNPVALTLTGVGLAWMMFGRSYDDRDDDRRITQPVDTDVDNNFDDRGTSSSPRTRRAYRPAFNSARRYDDNADWAYADIDDDDDDGDGLLDRASDAGSRAGQSVSDGAKTAAGAVKSAGGTAADGAKGAASAVGSAASSAASGALNAADGVAEGARNTAQGISNAASNAARRAERTRQRLAAGTEELSEAARERVIMARSRFIDARRRAEAAARRQASRGADAVGDFIDDQPLVAGALAMAVGAALAGALPGTKREDELFGAKSDELYDEAERIFQRESAKAQKVAGKVADEVKDIADEKRDEADNLAPGEKSAVQKAADEVRDATERVVDTAKSEAEKTDLGKPKS